MINSRWDYISYSYFNFSKIYRSQNVAAMEIINFLGLKISQMIKISPPAARGLLKLSIIDELGPFKSYDKITLKELESVLENSLKRRLFGLDVLDANKIIEILVHQLIENQSLMTISNV